MPPPLKKPDAVNLSIIVIVYVFIFLLARLYTLSPVDDDWSYIRAAETFFNTGRISLTPWTSPSLVFQILWGCLFAGLMGFSVNSLVFSTQVISLIGMLFFYLLLRRINAGPRRALVYTLVLILNPFSFPLLFTFFTDHHYLALVIISSFFYYRGAEKGRLPDIFLGSLAATCALLVRQPGLLVAAGAGLYFLVCRRSWSKALLSAALPLAGFIAFTGWFRLVHGPTDSSEQQIRWIIECLQSPVYLLSKLLNRPLLILEFFGFSLIPFSLALLPAPRALLSKKQPPLVLAFCFSTAVFFLMSEHLGIYSCIYTWMNGFHFAYVSEYGFRSTRSFLLLVYKALDFAAVFSIVWLTRQALKGRRHVKRLPGHPELVLLFIGLFQLIFLLVVRYKFTRYYVLLLPFFVLALHPYLKNIKLRRAVLVPLLAGFAFFSLAGTQDFMAWNEARWQLGREALSRGISPRKISAGFPWDCWHNMNYCLANPHDIKPQTPDIPWWFEELVPAVDPEYLISNSPVPSGFYYLRYFSSDRYAPEKTAEYFSLLYLDTLKIFLLRRIEPWAPDAPGRTVYRFAQHLAGATISAADGDREKELQIKSGGFSPAGELLEAIVQPAGTAVSFRVPLPNGNCRLSARLSTSPDTWQMPGDGVTFKVMLSDSLLENLFDGVGMVGVKQRTDFLMPRSYFFGLRTIYRHYLDPKRNPRQQAWQPICFDLSRFAGRVVDISLSAGPGPEGDGRFDVALWGDPVIEAY